MDLVVAALGLVVVGRPLRSAPAGSDIAELLKKLPGLGPNPALRLLGVHQMASVSQPLDLGHVGPMDISPQRLPRQAQHNSRAFKHVAQVDEGVGHAGQILLGGGFLELIKFFLHEDLTFTQLALSEMPRDVVDQLAELQHELTDVAKLVIRHQRSSERGDSFHYQGAPLTVVFFTGFAGFPSAGLAHTHRLFLA